ncbi:replication initiation factor domain-containing protein [Snodgrassella sp. CFCC 13594]|uniref:replication initiation factor domain-containing protein n=1 Tax=Snodgrassella sp. CFCC 13594 TaxID=1775559 RepID=UPI000831563A|nr:replication initiation factor domain-containing protein [Snodgrassella sp. CFCC 13594]
MSASKDKTKKAAGANGQDACGRPVAAAARPCSYEEWAQGFEARHGVKPNNLFQPPISNRGGAGTETDASTEQGFFERYSHFITDGKGRLIEVPLRRGKGNSAFIDQLSFSMHEDTLSLSAGYPLVADEEYIYQISIELEKIFGFGITAQAPHSGGRFYQSCFLMASDTAQYGRVHFGGQNNTMLIELTGTGCNAATSGWEMRLHGFLTKAIRPKITRIDITKDFFNGEYTPEQAKHDRLSGRFTNHHMMPDGESVGSDWESNNAKGKTYYVGSRESSKFVRVYEKGKQLGDKSSNWVRFEIEFKAKDIVIPFEALLVPGEFFGGAYPICQDFQEKARRIPALKKSFELTFERGLQCAKQQVGRMLNAVVDRYPDLTDSQILAMFKPDHNKLPKRLTPDVYAVECSQETWLHKRPKAQLLDEFGMFLELRANAEPVLSA